MARIKPHLLLRFAQRTWTEASGGHSRALGLCVRNASFCAHASLFNVVSGPVGAWGWGWGHHLLEGQRPSLWLWTLIRGTLPVWVLAVEAETVQEPVCGGAVTVLLSPRPGARVLARGWLPLLTPLSPDTQGLLTF